MAVPDSLVDAALNMAAIDHAGNAVTRLYQVVLGRDPDPAGYAGWLMRAAAGENIVEAFMSTPEAQKKIGK